MRYFSVCSGIEAVTVAWEPLGWEPVAFAEIDPFPSAVLARRFPAVPNLGDFTGITADDVGPVDLLAGGTPCQSFSVAGLRKGLDDERGNLALEFLRLAGRLRPVWLVWENVPGVLSSHGGRDFGALLGGLVELGYGWAYRVLDAQYFGVPQRRRRVFVVGHLGDRRRAAAVLFERHCLSGHPPPRREAESGVAPSVTPGARRASGARSGEQLTIAPALTGKPWSDRDCQHDRLILDGTAGTAVAFNVIGCGQQGRNHAYPTEVSGCLQHKGLAASGNEAGTLIHQSGVRRLTPLECERLMGFPDGWTLVPYRGKPAADGPRYRAIGNSMAVPVVRWVGGRIAAVHALAAGVAS